MKFFGYLMKTIDSWKLVGSWAIVDRYWFIGHEARKGACIIAAKQPPHTYIHRERLEAIKKRNLKTI